MKRYLLLVLSVIFVASIHYGKPHKKIEEQIFQAPPKGIVDYTLGFNGVMSSLFWVRAVQDLNICDQKRNVEGNRTLYDVSLDDPIARVLEQELPKARCELGWVYQMIDVVTDLDPTFRAAYEIGGTFLSVTVDDREGANRIFSKGTAYFPEDWRLLFSAAYNELFEMKNPEAAAKLLHKAANKGAPPWIYSLAAGIYTKLGQATFAKSILESVVARKPDGPMASRIQVRLDQINKLLKEEAENKGRSNNF